MDGLHGTASRLSYLFVEVPNSFSFASREMVQFDELLQLFLSPVAWDSLSFQHGLQYVIVTRVCVLLELRSHVDR